MFMPALVWDLQDGKNALSEKFKMTFELRSIGCGLLTFAQLFQILRATE